MASEMDEQKASLKENILFYTTAFFCLVAVFSVFIFLFLVPFFIEPALATIYMEFDPQPVMCETTEATFHRGLSNCQWSSCREGCTKEVYECWHIRVRYHSSVPVGKADARSVRDRIVQSHQASLADLSSSSSSSNQAKNIKTALRYSSSNAKGPNSNLLYSDSGFLMSSASMTSSSTINEDRIQSVLPEDEEEGQQDGAAIEETYALADQGGENGMHVHEARLQPNVKGCGYPPDVECNNTFASAYGVVGANFSCYYSLIDPTLAITHLNIDKVRAELIYCLTIPIILFVISVVYLFYAYFKIYAEPTTSRSDSIPKGASSNFDSKHMGLNLDGSQVEGVVVSQPISSPLHTGGKYGLLHQFPSPDTTRIVRRARSGGAIAQAAASASERQSAAKNPTSKSDFAGHRGMRMSKSMGDSRRIATSPLASPINPTCPKLPAVVTERSKKDWETSLSVRPHVCHQGHSSASPSEEEVTLPV